MMIVSPCYAVFLSIVRRDGIVTRSTSDSDFNTSSISKCSLFTRLFTAHLLIALFPLFVLSLANHQEARFLLPLTISVSLVSALFLYGVSVGEGEGESEGLLSSMFASHGINDDDGNGDITSDDERREDEHEVQGREVEDGDHQMRTRGKVRHRYKGIDNSTINKNNNSSKRTNNNKNIKKTLKIARKRTYLLYWSVAICFNLSCAFFWGILHQGGMVRA